MRKWRHGITVLGLRDKSTSLRISGRYPLAVDIEKRSSLEASINRRNSVATASIP